MFRWATPFRVMFVLTLRVEITAQTQPMTLRHHVSVIFLVLCVVLPVVLNPYGRLYPRL
jgi:hypothetical protein